jgi:hypothetical protein
MEWRKIAHGIELLEWRVLEQRVHNVVIRIDLANPALDIIAYPDNIDGGVFAAKKPEDFARETGAAVVINATPFSLPSGVLSKNRSLSGIYRVGKHELSAPVARYAALGFLADNSAFVVRSQADSIPESARLVAGGFFCILENGAVVPMKAASLDARMAAGVSPDKKTLFILCVEGNGGLFPRGMSYEECAIVLSCLGASDALQFDGGCSVALGAGGAILAGRFGRTPANLLGFVISVP